MPAPLRRALPQHAGRAPRRRQPADRRHLLSRSAGEGFAIEALAAGHRYAAALAREFAREWPEWAATVARERREAMFAGDARGGLPRVLVATEGGRLLGTVALRAWFAEAPMPETPWMRQLLVVPEARGRGVGSALVAAAEAQAAALGHPAIYTATDRIEAFLLRRGWEVTRRVPHGDTTLAWLVRRSRTP